MQILINPFDILVDYDIVESDGSIPGDGDVNTLVQMFQAISSNPILSNQFDVVRIFQRIARMSGIKDINDFKAKGQIQGAQATTLPDNVVQNEVQKGNMIPV